MAKKKFYVVWHGRNTGIFESWDECNNQIKGFSGAKYKAFPTRQQAEQAFGGRYEQYKGKTAKVPPSQKRLIQVGKAITPSYCVDAACSGNPGKMEYRGVETASGREVFRSKVYPRGTNNIGEFLAIAHALEEFKKQGIDLPIYSDSKHGMAWVKRKWCNTTLPRDEETAEAFRAIYQAKAWLDDNDYANKILKWETDVWGEIPADFGRK